MAELKLTGRSHWLRACGFAASAATLLASPLALATTAAVSQTATDRPTLTARVSRWQGDPIKKKKGPPGFDLQFRLVGARFDGTFGIEGLPQSVPQGEAFDAQIKLTNIGGKKDITVASVSVTADGASLPTEVLAKKVDPKTAVTVASFKVPAQSSAGSTLLITVVLSNGDKHAATLKFSPRS